MAKSVGVHQAKTHLSRLLDDVAAGEDVEITRHALAAGTLPMHHRDPFDRLLIAQATLLAIPILTADSAFDDYDVEVLAID